MLRSHARRIVDRVRRSTIVPLRESMARAVQHMTFPAYRHLLSLAETVRHPDDGDTRRVQPAGTVAMLGDHPIGLALAERPLDTPDALDALDAVDAPTPGALDAGGTPPSALLSLFVDRIDTRPRHRHRARRRARRRDDGAAAGPARSGLHDRQSRRGARSNACSPNAAGSRRRCGPTRCASRPTMRSGCRGSAACRSATATSRCSRGAISDRSSATRSSRHSRRGPGFPMAWSSGVTITPASIRCRASACAIAATVVGWTINHRLAADTTRISGAFVRDDLSRRGRLMALWTESITRMRGRRRALDLVDHAAPARADGGVPRAPLRAVGHVLRRNARHTYRPATPHPALSPSGARVSSEPPRPACGERRCEARALTQSDASPGARTRLRGPSVRGACPVPRSGRHPGSRCDRH